MLKRSWGYCTICASIFIVLLTGSTRIVVAQVSSPSNSPWIGTWAVAPVQDAHGISFARQTLRQIVHASVGGTSARIHISNAFGTEPLRVEDVHIALQGNGSSIVPGTDRKVRFGGEDAITIAPGAAAVSDSIEFHVPALADVAISFYLPESEGPATYHDYGDQTNYIAPGDQSDRQNLPQSATTTKSYYFLSNLDVQGQSLRGSVVTLGASVTDGYKSTLDANHRWPNFLAQRLVDAGLGTGVLNEGISGNRLLRAGAGQSAEDRFDRDVLMQPGVRWVIFSDDPINDLGLTRPIPTANELIAAIERLISRAHLHHIQFFCSTLTPYRGAGYWTPAEEVVREKINAFVRSKNSGCDAVIDQDVAVHDPAHSTRYLPAYDSGDHLHPTDAGYRALADAVDLALFDKADSSNK